MKYGSESGVANLHGVLDANSFRFSNETWAYDYASNTWTNMQPAGASSGRNYHGLTYDADADRVLSIGGTISPNAATYVPTNDVFAYDFNENVGTRIPGRLTSEKTNLEAGTSMEGPAKMTEATSSSIAPRPSCANKE